MAYRLEKAVSRNPEEFGHGAVEGVAGPEAANNAAATSGLVPLLALGIPFSPVLALVMAAMMVHGVQPGPLLVTRHPDLFWGVLASMYLGNLALLALNLPLVGIWVRLLRIPQRFLIVAIVLFSVVGTYAVRNSVFDLWVLVGFGVLGYVLQKLDLDRAPLVLGLVLGPFVEKHLRESLFLSRGDPTVFVSSGIALGIWAVGAVILLYSPVRALLRRGRSARRHGA
jgi:putative tricarboxylic transport membrane protein